MNGDHEKLLIVNADDFGLSEGVNRGIIRAHEEGIVTSTSLMVRYPAATQAAAYAREHPRLSVGLHLDLGEWKRDGEDWSPRYRVVNDKSRRKVRRKIGAQIEKFRELMGRDPTHLDSHQHVHRDEPVRSEMWNLSQRLGVPLRFADRNLSYCGDFYGETSEEKISVPALIHILATLDAGVTELACHPGDDDKLESSYRLQRRREVETLTDPAVKQAISQHGITLVSFARFAKAPVILEPPQRPRGLRGLLRFVFAGS